MPWTGLLPHYHTPSRPQRLHADPLCVHIRAVGFNDSQAQCVIPVPVCSHLSAAPRWAGRCPSTLSVVHLAIKQCLLCGVDCRPHMKLIRPCHAGTQAPVRRMHGISPQQRPKHIHMHQDPPARPPACPRLATLAALLLLHNAHLWEYAHSTQIGSNPAYPGCRAPAQTRQSLCLHEAQARRDAAAAPLWVPAWAAGPLCACLSSRGCR